MTTMFPTTLAIFGLPGGWEAVVLLALGVLIFGRRLPEVGRGVGKGIVEFKRGLAGIEDDIDQASTSSRPANSQSVPSAQQPGGTLPGGNTADAGPVNAGTPVGAPTGTTGSS